MLQPLQTQLLWQKENPPRLSVQLGGAEHMTADS